jgi:hypothetical protein
MQAGIRPDLVAVVAAVSKHGSQTHIVGLHQLFVLRRVMVLTRRESEANRETFEVATTREPVRPVRMR